MARKKNTDEPLRSSDPTPIEVKLYRISVSEILGKNGHDPMLAYRLTDLDIMKCMARKISVDETANEIAAKDK